MKDETDLELAKRLAIEAGKILAAQRINNPVPEDVTKRKAYGEVADRISHNFLTVSYTHLRAHET